MRRICLLLTLATLALVAGCGGHSIAAQPTPSPASATEQPPAWVVKEASWQALAAGDPHPRRSQWVLTTPARAAFLSGKATAYLRAFTTPAAKTRKLYVIVLTGRFLASDRAEARTERTLYLVMTKDAHSYLAHGFARRLDLAPLGRLHAFKSQLPTASGVWGHTMFVGRPFPGDPWPLAHVGVAVWRGHRAPSVGRPLMTVHSDAIGFFTLDLPPGVYTFRLSATNHGWPQPDTVTVKAGQLVAVAIYGAAA